jgi:hypothetical protein
MTYPIAFKTPSGHLFEISTNYKSADGSPRYVPNPNSPTSTYSYQTLMNEKMFEGFDEKGIPKKNVNRYMPILCVAEDGCNG